MLKAIAAVSVLFAASQAYAAPAPNTMPDPRMTPGMARDPPLSIDEICNTTWGKDERAVSDAMKLSVYHAYGFSGPDDPRCIPDHPGSPTAKTCEIDHLISREVGGADNVRNVWPEPYGGPWNAHDKDRLENALHKDICNHVITPGEATTKLLDWQNSYIAKYGGPPKSAQ